MYAMYAPATAAFGPAVTPEGITGYLVEAQPDKYACSGVLDMLDIGGPDIGLLDTGGLSAAGSSSVENSTNRTSTSTSTTEAGGTRGTAVDGHESAGDGSGGEGESDAAEGGGEGVVAGPIALIKRSDSQANACFFVDKVRHAERAGAVAVIIYDYEEERPTLQVMQGESVNITIPSVFVSYEAGVVLLEELGKVNSRLSGGTSSDAAGGGSEADAATVAGIEASAGADGGADGGAELGMPAPATNGTSDRFLRVLIDFKGVPRSKALPTLETLVSLTLGLWVGSMLPGLHRLPSTYCCF